MRAALFVFAAELEQHFTVIVAPSYYMYSIPSWIIRFLWILDSTVL